MKIFVIAFALCSLFVFNAQAAPLDGLKDLENKFEQFEQDFLASEKFPYSKKLLATRAEAWMGSFLDLEKMLLAVSDQAVYMSQQDKMCLQKEIKNKLLKIMFDRAKEVTVTTRITRRSDISLGELFGIETLYATIRVSYDFSTDEEDRVGTVKYHVYQNSNSTWYVYDLESWGFKFSTYYRWFKLSGAKENCGI